MAEAQETATGAAARSRQFVDNLKKRDFAALAELYTNDAVMMPPGANIIMGKGNIQSYWQKMSDEMEDVAVRDRQRGSVWAPTRFARSAGFGCGRNRSLPPAMEQPGAQDQQQRAAKYVFLWQKVGGDWKMVASIWNRIEQNRGQGAGARRRTGRRWRWPHGRRRRWWWPRSHGRWRTHGRPARRPVGAAREIPALATTRKPAPAATAVPR